MRIVTDTQECKVKSQLAMSRIISKVRSRQPEHFSSAPELEALVRHTTEPAYDDSSNALVLVRSTSLNLFARQAFARPDSPPRTSPSASSAPAASASARTSRASASGS
jgi:hypothetical protein